MKNSIYFKYCVDKKLLNLLGIKEEEILEVNSFQLDIKFKRYGNKYKIDINTTYEKNEIRLQLSRKYGNQEWGPHLFRLNGVTSEEDFTKFRRLLDEFVIDTKTFKCNEIT